MKQLTFMLKNKKTGKAIYPDSITFNRYGHFSFTITMANCSKEYSDEEFDIIGITDNENKRWVLKEIK